MSKLLIANWKSNHNLQEALLWLEQVGSFLQQSLNNPKLSELIIVLAPPVSMLSALTPIVKKYNLQLAVQDLSQYQAGSYTGAISSKNLQGLDVYYAILGHSERRKYFAETDKIVAQKLQQALQADINPILCLDRPYFASQQQVLNQDIQDQNKLKNSLVIAYEPVTAIGSGNNEPIEQVMTAVAEIKQLYQQVPVLYGGSVTEENVAQYLQVTDGVLVGGASLTGPSFIKLLQAIAI